MDKTPAPTRVNQGEADKVMQAVSSWAQAAQASGHDLTDTAALSHAVGELLDQETSFADQNAKRLRLVTAAFNKHNFETMVNVVDTLMDPLDVGVNRLLERSSLLKSLRFNNPGSQMDLEGAHAKCQKVFLQWSSGHFGTVIVKDLITRLKSSELAQLCQVQPLSSSSGDQSLAQTCFELVMFAASDVWRLCIFAMKAFPYCLFSLVECEDRTEDFLSKWAAFREILAHCPSCVDAAFSAPLLRSVSFGDHESSDDNEALLKKIRKIQTLLQDIATHCPLATDAVENLHGCQQSALHAFRGKLKSPQVAAECSVLASLQTEHALLKSIVEDETYPHKLRVANQLKSTGRSHSHRTKTKTKSSKTRLAQASVKRLRTLCGWNVFQRKKMQEHGVVPPEQYKQVLKNIGNQWKSLSAEEKSQYHLRSAYEQELRDEVVTRPLACKRQCPEPEQSDEDDDAATATDIPATATHRLEAAVGHLPAVTEFTVFPVQWCTLSHHSLIHHQSLIIESLIVIDH